MSEWQEYRIKDICQIIGGYAFKSKDFKSEGDIPIIKIKSLKNKNIVISDGDFVDSEFLKLNDKYHINHNDYVIALTGSHITLPSSAVGRVAKSKHERVLLLNQRVAKFKVNDEICSHDFLYYFLTTDYFFQNIGLRAKGAANQANVSAGDVGSIKINLPPIPTQQKIAKILSNYDDLIENNLKRIKLLEESARLTYEEWFLRFRIDGKKLDIDPESGLPYGWEQSTLGSLVAFHGGYAFKSTDYEENQKYKIVTIKNVQDGYFISSTTDTISTIPDNIKPSQKLNNGNYIMSLTGNVGRICLVYGENYLLNQRVVKLEPKKSIDYSFLYSLFRHKNMLYQLQNISNGAAQQNLSPVNAAKIKLPIPGEEFREKFNNKIKPAIDSIINLNLQNQFLKEARVILLPLLTTGMIDTEKIDVAL